MSIAIIADGDFEIPETSSRVLVSVAGTFGTALVSVGFYVNPANSATFRPYVNLNNRASAFDEVVTKGQGLKLVIRVTNAGGTTLEAVHSPVS